MNNDHEITKTETTQAAPLGSDESAGAANGNLAAWLNDDKTAEFFGDSFALKAAVLACLLEHGNMAAVARAHAVTRAAASKQARRAKDIFGEF